MLRKNRISYRYAEMIVSGGKLIVFGYLESFTQSVISPFRSSMAANLTIARLKERIFCQNKVFEWLRTP